MPWDLQVKSGPSWLPVYKPDRWLDCELDGLIRMCLFLLGLYSLSGKTSYRKISWSLEAGRFGFKLFQSLWNLAGTSATLLPRCLSNFRAIWPLQHPISWLRDFTRFGGKTSYHSVNRGPVSVQHCVGNDTHGHWNFFLSKTNAWSCWQAFTLQLTLPM